MPFATPTRVNDWGETEKQCGKCGEWWPMTKEFFEQNPRNHHFKSPCKACKYEHWMSQPCSAGNCSEPRWNTGTRYCRDHHYLIRIGRPARWQHKPKQVRT